MDSLFHDHDVITQKFDAFRGRLVEFLTRPSIDRFTAVVNAASSLSYSPDFITDCVTRCTHQMRSVDLLCLVDEPPISIVAGRIYVAAIHYSTQNMTDNHAQFTFGVAHTIRAIIISMARQKLANLIDDKRDVLSIAIADALASDKATALYLMENNVLNKEVLCVRTK